MNAHFFASRDSSERVMNRKTSLVLSAFFAVNVRGWQKLSLSRLLCAECVLTKTDDFMQGWENSMLVDCRQLSSVVQREWFASQTKDRLSLSKKAFDEDLRNAAEKIVVWGEKWETSSYCPSIQCGLWCRSESQPFGTAKGHFRNYQWKWVVG